MVSRSENISWYKGPALLEYLETIEVQQEKSNSTARFQVQYVIRPQTTELHDYRGYAGSVLSGTLKKGQEVTVLPSGATSKISRIEYDLKDVETATEDQPVVLHLEDDLDISRGNTIVASNQLPFTDKAINATICWMDNSAFQNGQKLLIQQGSFRSKAAIKEIYSKIDIHSYDQLESDGVLKLNELAKVGIRTAEPISSDFFKENRKTGAFILINENTNQTVAAGIIEA